MVYGFEWAQYLESVNILDQKVAQLLEKLERDGLDKNTIIVFSGDMRTLLAENKLTPALAAYFKPKEELYDIKNDPWELNNLASSPKHKHLLDTMRAELDKWIVETDDQGRFLESEEVLKEMKKLDQDKKERRKERKSH